MEESNPLCCEVLTGSSRRLQPREFIESRKEEEAMATDPEGREREGTGSTTTGQGRSGYVDRAAQGQVRAEIQIQA